MYLCMIKKKKKKRMKINKQYNKQINESINIMINNFKKKTTFIILFNY